MCHRRNRPLTYRCGMDIGRKGIAREYLRERKTGPARAPEGLKKLENPIRAVRVGYHSHDVKHRQAIVLDQRRKTVPINRGRQLPFFRKPLIRGGRWATTTRRWLCLFA